MIYYKINLSDKFLANILYEIGKEYSTKYSDEEVSKNGDRNLGTDKIFHCCRDVENVNKFTSNLFNSKRRFLEVKLLGPIVSRNGDCGSNRIKILREVKINEQMSQI